MELRSTIENRRSIRHYNNKDLSKEILNDLLDCGRLAPSAKNRQPWFFVVVKNDIKDKIVDLMINWCVDNNLETYCKKKNTSCSVSYTANVIKEANTLVLVFKEKDNEWFKCDTLSIGASIQNILLRATDLKIGSLWINDIDNVQSEVEKLFNYPDYELCSSFVLGYSDINPKQRPRKELKDIVIYYE